MKLLVDTCILIWALQSPSKINRASRALLEDGANEIIVSVISFWEISLKHSMGRLIVRKTTPEAIPGYVEEMGWTILPLDARTSSTLHRLPLSKQHRDPFDRILIWTAITHRLPLVTADSSLHFYAAAGLQLAG